MEYKDTNAGYGYVVRLEKGEKIVASLMKLSEKENITGGFFYGLGAVINSEIGYFDTEKGGYVFTNAEEFRELASINGTIALAEGRPVVHMHGVLSDKKLQTLAGHIKEAEVGGTCEIFIHLQHGAEMTRSVDKETGLNLLHFE